MCNTSSTTNNFSIPHLYINIYIYVSVCVRVWEVGVPFKGFLKHILTFYDFRQLIYMLRKRDKMI